MPRVHLGFFLVGLLIAIKIARAAVVHVDFKFESLKKNSQKPEVIRVVIIIIHGDPAS